MTNFFEIDDDKKTIKILNLDDFSIEDLNVYIEELNLEIKRVELEIKKKESSIKNAEKFFE